MITRYEFTYISTLQHESAYKEVHMNITDFNLSLDISGEESQLLLCVKRGDTARRLRIRLHEQGKPYALAEPVTGVFTAKKPDGTILYNSCDISEDTVIYLFDPQLTSAVGEVLCELRLYGGEGELLICPRFSVLVTDTVFHDGDVVNSSSEFSALTELVGQTLEILSRWQELTDGGEFHPLSAAIRSFDSALQAFRDADSAGLPVIDPESESGYTNMILRRMSYESGGSALPVPTVGTVKEWIEAALKLGYVDLSEEYVHALGAAAENVPDFLWQQGAGNFFVHEEKENGEKLWYYRGLQGQQGKVLARSLVEIGEHCSFRFFTGEGNYHSPALLHLDGKTGRLSFRGEDLGRRGTDFDGGFLDDRGCLHLTKAGEEIAGFTPIFLGELSGASAYEVAVNKGFRGSEEQWLASLCGPAGKSPQKGIDYFTPEEQEQCRQWIAAELAKRGQLRPEFANSVEDCREENKLYVLPDGYLYGYLLTEHVEGGYTNRIDTKDANFKIGTRFNASNGEVSTGYPNAFVSNHIPVVCNSSHHDMIRIRGVKDAEGTDGTRPRFRIMCYDAQGNLVVGLYMSNEATANNYILDKTTVEDGVYLYELGVSRNGNHDFDNKGISTIRIAGVATDGMENVTVTVDEELIEATTVKKYAWANTGHAFIPGDYEERILALEKESQELQGQMEGIKKDSEAAFAEIRQEMEGLSRGQGGLRWFALGDSITEGWASEADPDSAQGYRQYILPSAQDRWTDQVAAKKGYKLSNYGIGGTGYLRAKENTLNARSLVDTLDFTQCDLVTLAYGVNDWKYAVNIGTEQNIPPRILASYEGQNSLKLPDPCPAHFKLYRKGKLQQEGEDYSLSAGNLVLTQAAAKGEVFDLYDTEESMVSNMCYVIKQILLSNPSCKIVVLSPLNCKSLGSYATNWGIHYKGSAANGLGLEDIFALQKAVCDYYGIELMDLTHNSIINRETIRTHLPDSIHPTKEAHKLLSQEISQRLLYN